LAICSRKKKQQNTSPFNLLKPENSHFESLVDGTFCVSKAHAPNKMAYGANVLLINNTSFVKPSEV
jgi:hypothetical protein